MSVECQVKVKSQSELDIGGRETCSINIIMNSKAICREQKLQTLGLRSTASKSLNENDVLVDTKTR